MNRARRIILWVAPVSLVLAIVALLTMHTKAGQLLAVSLALGSVAALCAWAGLTAVAHKKRVGGSLTVVAAVASLIINVVGVWTPQLTQDAQLPIIGRELTLVAIVLTVASLTSSITVRGLRIAGRILTVVTILFAVNYAPLLAGGQNLVIPENTGLDSLFVLVIVAALLLYPISLGIRRRRS